MIAALQCAPFKLADFFINNCAPVSSGEDDPVAVFQAAFPAICLPLWIPPSLGKPYSQYHCALSAWHAQYHWKPCTRIMESPLQPTRRPYINQLVEAHCASGNNGLL